MAEFFHELKVNPTLVLICVQEFFEVFLNFFYKT